tara:strand:+ start:516 stop:926 length:411 start_codon:yes stop_codon:yes gene_type:complete
MSFKYQEKPLTKLKQNYSSRKKHNGFESFDDFLDWYNTQTKACHYCGVSEHDCQEIVMTGLLTSNRFPQNGVLGRGQSRGVWLEVDRLKPKGKYSRENAVLCCYFCNNDKSDVFDGDDYFQFMQNRHEFLKRILNK